MTARGYGVGRRSRFSIFGWQKSDKALMAATVLFGAAAVLAIGLGKLAYVWYPQIETPGASPAAVLCYAAYALLGAIPVYLQLKEEARWRSLQSEI